MIGRDRKRLSCATAPGGARGTSECKDIRNAGFGKTPSLESLMPADPTQISRITRLHRIQRVASWAGAATHAAAGRARWIVDRYATGNSLAGHLKRLFALYEVDCVIDVGANRGQFGAMLRRVGYTGRIVSFEPVPEAFDELSAAIARDDRWEAHRLALGDRAGVVPMNVTASTSVSSFFTPTAEYAASYAGGRVERVEDVEVVRLESVFDALAPDPHVFLKVDTQGSDLAVLEGARGRLDRLVGAQIELSVMPIYEGTPSYIEALQFMKVRGFTPSGMFPVVRDELMRAYEFDGVFVRDPQRAGSDGEPGSSLTSAASPLRPSTTDR